MTASISNVANTPFGEHVYAVILAGGSGTRFWPKSRHLQPKQLCKIGHPTQTMIEQTLARLDGLIPPSRRLIVTHKEQAAATRAIVRDQCPVILAEPEARNTANALAMAALHIEAVAKGSAAKPVMISLHADALIKDEPAFRAALRASIQVAEQGYLTLMGIVPEYPETGYGYIEQGTALKSIGASNLSAFQVQSFREKPPLDVATDYVESGRFFWNAGLFTWQTSVLLEELSQRLPLSVSELAPLVGQGRGFDQVPLDIVASAYSKLPKISIDNAVLEVSRRVAVVPAAIGWQDIGSWDGLARAFTTDAAGNQTFGDALLLETTGTTIDSDGPFIATLGLKDMVVVSAKGAVLVCPKERSQDVKLIVEWLKEHGKKDLT